MQILCSKLAKNHRARMKDMILKLDESIKEKLDFLHSKEIEKSLKLGKTNMLPGSTKFELENLLFTRFDVHKKHVRSKKLKQKSSQSWELGLNEFIEKERMRSGMGQTGSEQFLKDSFDVDYTIE